MTESEIILSRTSKAAKSTWQFRLNRPLLERLNAMNDQPLSRAQLFTDEENNRLMLRFCSAKEYDSWVLGYILGKDGRAVSATIRIRESQIPESLRHHLGESKRRLDHDVTIDGEARTTTRLFMEL